ncbi:MAG: hypothetical protein WA056_08295 [Gallionella sp.]
MDKTRSNIILYMLTGISALAVPAIFSDGPGISPLLLASLAPALLARIGLKQLDAAHSLSAQLGEMIEREDIRHLFVPTPASPEMNAIGHQLNVLLYSLNESVSEDRMMSSRQAEAPSRNTPRPSHNGNLKVVADAA